MVVGRLGGEEPHPSFPCIHHFSRLAAGEGLCSLIDRMHTDMRLSLSGHITYADKLRQERKKVENFENIYLHRCSDDR